LNSTKIIQKERSTKTIKTGQKMFFFKPLVFSTKKNIFCKPLKTKVLFFLNFLFFLKSRKIANQVTQVTQSLITR